MNQAHARGKRRAAVSATNRPAAWAAAGRLRSGRLATHAPLGRPHP